MTVPQLEILCPQWNVAPENASGRETCHAIYETCCFGDDKSSDQPPLLILGGNEVSAEELTKRGVTHILSLLSLKRGQKKAAESSGDEFERLVIDIEDDYDADLFSTLQAAHDFIDKSRTNDGLCYVHCEMGRSRSASMVISWLMHWRYKNGQQPSLIDCYAAVASRRRITALNYGFFAVLCDFEAELGAADSSLPLLSYFRLMQHPSSGIFRFTPVPELSELLHEVSAALDTKASVSYMEVGQRELSIRKALKGFVYVLRELSPTSRTCRTTLQTLGVECE